MTEFTGIGQHCSAESCNQQDFLPFKCDCCLGTYCLPHRGYREHSCPASGDKDFRAVVCPLCKKTVRFAGSQDPNEQWALHARTDCSPQDNGSNTSKKKRCAAASCRETLGPTNTQRCHRCTRETCLAHRFPDSHDCTAARLDGRRAAASAAVARQAQQPRPLSLREKAAQRRAAIQENTARATADSRRIQGGAGSGGSIGGGERCPQCGAGFPDVTALVAHVEVFHFEVTGGRSHAHAQPTGSAGVAASGEGGGESCPICQIWVADAALLVSHVQVAHPDYGGAERGRRAAAGVAGMMSDGAKNCTLS